MIRVRNFRASSQKSLQSLQYLLLVVPGENGDGVVQGRLCKFAEGFAHETERGKAFELDYILYYPWQEFWWKVAEHGHGLWEHSITDQLNRSPWQYFSPNTGIDRDFGEVDDQL